jgi:hypothetical protein
LFEWAGVAGAETGFSLVAAPRHGETLKVKFVLRPRFFGLLALCAITSLVRLGPTSLRAQAPALAPELSELQTKYQTGKKQLTQTRDQTLGAAQKAYVTALDAAERQSTAAGKPDELRSITEERAKLDAGKLAPSASSQLPKTLAAPRIIYQREAERVNKDYQVRSKQLESDYLRSLGSLEAAAHSRRQDTLLAQIALLKKELMNPGEVSVAPVPPLAGPNLAVNGDFSKPGVRGLPDKWMTNNAFSGTIVTEGDTTFYRMTTTSEKVAVLRQAIDVPEGTKEVLFSIRLRCPSMKGKGKFGINVWQRDAKGQNVQDSDPFPEVAGEARTWKQYSGTIKLHPNARNILVRLLTKDAMTVLDIDDIRVEAR